MKRIKLIWVLALAAFLGAAPTAFGAPLKPVTGAPAEYAKASGSASMHWKQYRCSYYTCYDGWAVYSFKGLAPVTNYALCGYTTEGTQYGLAGFGTDLTGSAAGNGAFYSDVTKFSIVRYELWSVWIDPNQPWVWYPVEVLLSSP